MKTTITALALTFLPSAAFAFGKHGGSHGGGGSLFAATFLMALVAVLGYAVLRYAEKDPWLVRWVGRVVGWVLVVSGLLGFLCGVWSHSKHAGTHKSCKGRSDHDGKPHHPPIDKDEGLPAEFAPHKGSH